MRKLVDRLRRADLVKATKVVIIAAWLLILLYDVFAVITQRTMDTISEVIYWRWSVDDRLLTPALFGGALMRHLFWPWFPTWSPAWLSDARFWSFVVLMLSALSYDLFSPRPVELPPVAVFAVGFFVIGPLWPMPGR